MFPSCLEQTFNEPWAEVLSVLLQSFADILLMLHLNKGLSRWPPQPVGGQMDAVLPIAYPTL